MTTTPTSIAVYLLPLFLPLFAHFCPFLPQFYPIFSPPLSPLHGTVTRKGLPGTLSSPQRRMRTYSPFSFTV